MKDCSLNAVPTPGAPPGPEITPVVTIYNSYDRLKEAAEGLEIFDWLLIAIVILVLFWIVGSKKGNPGNCE